MKQRSIFRSGSSLLSVVVVGLIVVALEVNLASAFSSTNLQTAYRENQVDSRRLSLSPRPRHNIATTTIYAKDKKKTEDDDDFDLFDDMMSSLTPDTSFGSEAVPEGQRPINEYLDVVRAPLFDWAVRGGAQGLITRLAVTYGVVYFVICFPIAGATYDTQPGDYFLPKVASANVGALALLFVLMVRLYSGWSYVGSRLTSKVIEYEETGWFDGDFELKSETEYRRDMFLYTNKVKPVVDRLKSFSLALGGMWVASCLALNVASRVDPLFNQYDPDMLEQLRYDDKLAEKAAKSTLGRPTYCDSRYYQAVAGGAGCNF